MLADPPALEVETSRPATGALQAAAAVAALLLASWPGMLFASWTQRGAVLVLVGCAGLALLAHDAWARRPAAIAAAALVAGIWLSSLVSAAPRSSTLGFVGRDLSAASVTLAIGCWAVGRASVGDDVTVRSVFTRVAAVVGLIGIAQVLLDIDSGFLALQNGRPASLLVNPVYFGAVCAAAAVAGAVRSAGERLDLEFGVVAVMLGAAVTLSGSRVALASLVLALLLLVGTRRTATAVRAAGVVGAGVGLGAIVDLAVGAGQSATNRLAEAGADGRLTVWGYGLREFLDRPVTGHGLGQFRPAVQGRFGTEFVRDHAPDDLAQPWFDPHNVVVLLLVSTGLVGVVLLAVWLRHALREASGPLLWAAATIALTWLLQPVSIHTLPLALLLLGAAAAAPESTDTDGEPGGRETSWVPVGLLVGLLVGVVVAGWLLVADLRLDAAAADLDPAAAASAAGWYGDDPIAANVVAQVYEFAGSPEELDWRRRAVDREPTRPLWWTELGGAQLRAGEVEAARASASAALDLQPTNVRANELLLAVLVRSEQRDEAGRRLDDLCDLAERWCGVTVADLEGSG